MPFDRGLICDWQRIVYSVFLRYLFSIHLMARFILKKIGCTASPMLEKQLVFYTCMEAWALRSILFKSCWYAVETPCNIFHLILIRIIQNSKNGMKCHGPLSHVHTRDISWAWGIDSVYSSVCVWTVSVQMCLLECLLQTCPHLDLWFCVVCSCTL